MKLKTLTTAVGLAISIVAASAADLAKGTEVPLVFKQSLSSRVAKAGQRIAFSVKNDVTDSSGKTVLSAGTPVWGTIERVDKRDHFGKNARIRITLNPVKGITLEPRDKGKMIGGTRTTEAAAASGGAALVFGPLGLVGGYFVVGHSVSIHKGDTLRTVVAD